MTQSQFKRITLMAGLIAAVSGCVVAPSVPTDAPVAVTPVSQYPVPVNPVAVSPVAIKPVQPSPTPGFLSTRVGNTVALQGSFAGWAGCAESSQVTKSDWVIRFADGQRMACAFVTGGVPAGIAPPPSTLSSGVPVAIHALVKSSPSSGKPYLQIISK